MLDFFKKSIPETFTTLQILMILCQSLFQPPGQDTNKLYLITFNVLTKCFVSKGSYSCPTINVILNFSGINPPTGFREHTIMPDMY